MKPPDASKSGEGNAVGGCIFSFSCWGVDAPTSLVVNDEN